MSCLNGPGNTLNLFFGEARPKNVILRASGDIAMECIKRTLHCLVGEDETAGFR